MRIGTVLRNALFGAFLLACVAGPPSVPPGSVGELGNGRFIFNEVSCDAGPCGVVPRAVALGGIFTLTFSGSAFVEAAAPELMAPSSVLRDGFTVSAPGQCALLATSGSDVVDLIHIRGTKIDHLQIVDGDPPDEEFPSDAGQPDGGHRDGGTSRDGGTVGDPPDSGELTDAGESTDPSDGGALTDAGESTDAGEEPVADAGPDDAGPRPPHLELSRSRHVEVRPVDSTGAVLAGTLTYTWFSSKPLVAQVWDHGSTATIVLVGVGTTTISVKAGDVQTAFDVTVREVP